MPGNGSNVCDTANKIDLTKNINYKSRLDAKNVGNGIKFDIKNSVVNCMSKVVPNAPIFNGGDASVYGAIQCAAAGLKSRDASPRNPATTKNPYSLIYLPLWDSRGTDASSNGCQRQVVNNCVQDIYDCGIGDDAKSDGSKHHLAHVFTKDEVNDLGGPGPMPTTYWRYKPLLNSSENSSSTQSSDSETSNSSSSEPAEPVIDQKSRWILSKVDPGVPGAQKIDVGPDPHLARIKAFKFDVGSSFKGDVSGFYVVDPSDFFDMRHYVKGGKYDSGYTDIDPATGLPMAQEACPIRGVSGYGGICDPTGKAGCNLPVYGIGPSTTFTDKHGKSSTVDQYPLKWSGYVKAWRVISKNQYLSNTENRKGPRNGALYASGKDVQDNPVLMVLRSNDYCDLREIENGQCIQYKQYQLLQRKNGVKVYTFVDLFMPSEDLGISNEMSKIVKTDFNPNGTPIRQFQMNLGWESNSNAPMASFMDPYMPKDNSGKDAIHMSNYESNPMKGTDGKRTIGDPIPGGGPGAAIKFSTGTTLGLRFLERNSDRSFKDYTFGDLLKPSVSQRCAIVKREPIPGAELFVPTGTSDEYKSFLTAASKGETIADVSAVNCAPVFEPYQLALTGMLQRRPSSPPPAAPANPNGLSTWIGTLTCDELIEQPSCNETKIITAQRYCVLSDGVQSSCGDCAGAVDPDEEDPKNPKKKFADFSQAAVQGKGIAELINVPNPDDASTMCYFRAACFSSASVGCPAPGTSGGHIFCLSADTKITMVDGSRKEIIKIAAGEKVLSFDAQNPRGKLFTSAVKSVAVTEGQRVMRVTFEDSKTVLKITPEHKVVLSSGRSVMARDLREGDELVDSKARVAVVADSQFIDEAITVYNLVLEDGADGYIATGLRVQSYPSNDASKH
jgi:hypothetical protein